MNNEEPKLSTMMVLALFSVSAALHNIDYIHRGHVCRKQGLQGSAFFTCGKNTPLLHVRAGTSRLQQGESHLHELNPVWGCAQLCLFPLSLPSLLWANWRVEDSPAHGRGLKEMLFNGPSNPNPSGISRFFTNAAPNDVRRCSSSTLSTQALIPQGQRALGRRKWITGAFSGINHFVSALSSVAADLGHYIQAKHK